MPSMTKLSGNAGDVLKHALLDVTITQASGGRMLVVETHAGPGSSMFMVPKGDPSRGHLLAAIPSPSTSWTGPYESVLKRSMLVAPTATGVDVTYPGSPHHVVLTSARADCLFIEKRLPTYVRLEKSISQQTACSGRTVRLLHQDWRTVASSFPMGLRPPNPRYDFVILHLDPWKYDPRGSHPAHLSRTDLTDAVALARRLAIDGIVAVFTFRNGTNLRADLSAAASSQAVLFEIAQSQPKPLFLNYGWCAVGIGPCGASLVAGASGLAPTRTGVRRSMPTTPVLATWGFQVFAT